MSVSVFLYGYIILVLMVAVKQHATRLTDISLASERHIASVPDDQVV